MKLSELFGRAGFCYPPEMGDIEITKIVTDSRKAVQGCLFLCIKGERIDGHGFAVDAIQKGASVIVAERVRDVCVGGAAAWIMLKNTRNAAALLYHAWYGCPADRLKIIGVTGTNGKTSVSFLLRELLERWGRPCGLIGTVGCRTVGGRIMEITDGDPLANMTTPDPETLYRSLAAMEADGAEYVVMEVSSHALAMSRTDAIFFRWAVFTNLTQDHLDFHGDMEHYYQAKRRLFSQCERAVLNGDDPTARRLAREIECPSLTYSRNVGDFCAQSVQIKGMEGSQFLLKAPMGESLVSLRMAGDFAIANALAASAVALSEGIPFSLLSEVLASTSGAEGRMERVDLGKDCEFSVILDYAHTPDALEQLCKTLLPLRKSGGRLLLLFGCGGDRDRGKRAQMGRIASSLADEIILTSDNCRSESREKILSDILKGVDKEKPHQVIEDREAAIEYALRGARRGDILVLAGKGHERYEINEKGRIPFDERKILRDCWQRLRP